ncbi:MAG TPA: serine hydrolase [Rubrobacter sp.]|nr:serine hydrolase [Rubrobacter sp.]
MTSTPQNTPQDTPGTRREWRIRRKQERTARHRFRRVLVGLPLLLALLVGLLLLPALVGGRPVARLDVPTARTAPKAPATKSEPDSGKGSQEDSNKGSQAGSGGSAEPVEVQLTARNKDALRKELQRIAQIYPANYGVVVFDPSSGETIAMGADQQFDAASLGKLPTLMALYKAAANGEVNLKDEISMQASDVQAYGTGVLYTYPIGYTMTLRECAQHLIKQSDNTAWKMLDRYLGTDYIRAELYRAGATSTEYWIPNITTPNDVLLMLEKISDPSYTTPYLSNEMLGLMQNTEFEDRLPQPLPEGTRVSHKIGYFGSTFADAGIVFPKGAEHTKEAYFIVVMASETGWGTSQEATQEMSLATYRALSEPENPPE